MAKVAATELEVAGHTVRVSNPDKIYFPDRGFTKLDVVQYYLNVGDGILRALRERPTTLERWPGGVIPGAKLSTRMDHTGDAFYQKRLPTKGVPEWIESAEIKFPSMRTAEELCPVDLAHVAWAAQLGTIVFHPWPVRRSDVDSPDELRHRPRSPAGYRFRRRRRGGRRGARACWTSWAGSATRRPPAAAGPTCTSGSLHSGLSRRYGGPPSPSAGRSNAAGPTRPPPNGGRRSVASGSSSTTTRWPATGPSRAHTRCGPAPNATVSTPVTWDELSQIDPNDFTLDTVQERFAKIGDPHATIDDVAHDITPLLEWSERDEQAGEGDMPYPPDHPKMPGEPPRVQPSRKNPANWENSV